MRLPPPALLATLLGSALAGFVPGHDPAVVSGFDTGAALDWQACASAGACATPSANLTTQWVSRTQSGNLFLVVQKQCSDPQRCSAWLVERTARGTDMRLDIEGQFQVVNSGQRIPDVQTWRAVADNETVYTRYRWVGGTFLKVETRHVYNVDGVECGTAMECYQVAAEALQHHQTDKALKIWEQVHNVSWI